MCRWRRCGGGDFLRAGLVAAGGTAIALNEALGQEGHTGHAGGAAPATTEAAVPADVVPYGGAHSAHGDTLTVGAVDEAANGFTTT